MTATRRPFARVLASSDVSSVVSTPATAASVAAVSAGLGLVLSAVVGAGDAWRGSAGLAATGGVAVLMGVVGVRRYRVARRDSPATAFAALVSVLLTQIAISTVAYLASGTFDRVDDAVFESASGFSTTALSVVEAPSTLPDAVVLWRALSQWSGGLTALVAVATVVPALGVARTDPSASRGGPRQLPLASRQALTLLRRLFRIYALLTGIGIGLYVVAGMGPFDALTYALTTVSSGGLGHHQDSLAHFDSAAVEFAAIGGMLLAGVNLAVVFRSARGLVSGQILRFAELRAFLFLVVGFSLVVTVTSDAGGDLFDRARLSLFSVVSMLSTTGLTATDWAGWSSGAQTLLIVAAGIGAMSGAVGGGFRVARVLAVVGFARREVIRQIHPTAVRVVKVGRRAVDEILVDRILGYQILYFFIGGLGAIGLALGGASVLTSLTGAISALGTAGPAMGELAPGGGAHVLAAPARAALIPLMILGRLELAPVLVGLVAIVRRRASGSQP